MDNKTGPVRPHRIGFDTTEEFKARLEEQAAVRGFDNYKSYIIALIERDRDILAGTVKVESKKHLPIKK